MKNKKILVAILALVLVGVIGGTVAYYTSTATFNNEFTTGTYSTIITEEFESPDNWTPGTTTSKKINVTNDGRVEVAVRAKIEESWTASNGNSLPLVRDEITIANYVIGTDWVLAEDGYYYYKNILTSKDVSSDFISSVTFNSDFTLKDGEDIKCTTSTEDGKTTVECVNLTSGYAGAKYKLNVTLETIQADQKWSYIAVDKLFYWGPGSTYLDYITGATINTSETTTEMLDFAKISNNVYESSEIEGIEGTFSRTSGQLIIVGVLSTTDVQYENDNYFYVYTDFSGPFMIVKKSFNSFTPGVYIITTDNYVWNDLQRISKSEEEYIVYQ